MVFAIFSHALKMIFTDLRATARISLPLIVVIVVQILLFGTMQPSQAQFNPMDAALQILAAIASLWVAVAWHRYVLLVERPERALPRLHVREMFHYFLWGLGLTLIMWLPTMIILLVGVSADAFGPGLAILVAVVMLVMAWVGARLSVVLPAAAIDQPLGLSAAWHATRPFAVGLIGLAILIVLMSAALGWLSLLLFLAVPIAGAAILGAVQWLMTLLMLSILTTLYGVYVEERELT